MQSAPREQFITNFITLGWGAYCKPADYCRKDSEYWGSCRI